MPQLENKTWEKFAHAVVSKKYASNIEAYRAIFPETNKSEKRIKYAYNNLMQEGALLQRIKELRIEIEEMFEKEQDDLKETFMTIAEKRTHLARVRRCDFSKLADGTFDFKKDGDLIQGVKQTKFGVEYVTPDKLRAIQIDNEYPGGGGVVDSAAQMLERLIRPGLPSDRMPHMIEEKTTKTIDV